MGTDSGTEPRPPSGDLVADMERAVLRMELLQIGVVPEHLDEAVQRCREREPQSGSVHQWAVALRASQPHMFVTTGRRDHKTGVEVLVKLLLGVLVAVPPLTAAIIGLIGGWWDYRLEQQKHQHEIRIGYLDRALDLDRPYESRRLLLEFIAASEERDLADWARKEVLSVDQAREDRIEMLETIIRLHCSETARRALEDAETSSVSVPDGDESTRAQPSEPVAEVVSSPASKGPEGASTKPATAKSRSVRRRPKVSSRERTASPDDGTTKRSRDLEVEPTSEPEAKPRDPQLAVKLDGLEGSISFEFDSSALRTSSTSALDELVELIEANPGVKIRIGVYTATISDKNFNLKLATKRARAVEDYLTRRNISRDRIEVVGYGNQGGHDRVDVSILQ